MIALKKYSFIFLVALAMCTVPMQGMETVKGGIRYLRKQMYILLGVDMKSHADALGVLPDATSQEINDAYNKKKREIEEEYNRKCKEAEAAHKEQCNAYQNNMDAIAKEHRKKTFHLHPDMLNRKNKEEIINVLKPYYPGLSLDTKTEEELRSLANEKLVELNAEFNETKNFGAKLAEDKLNAQAIYDAKKTDAQVAHNKLTSYAFFIDLYLVGGLAVVSTATIVGLVKAWNWYREYRSPNTVLLEKMLAAAIKSTSLVLNLAFDRYNPTKDTDALSLQFDIDPLLAQLSSDAVRNRVRQAIMAFDKTLEATYEQCAWHYDGITFKELKEQNPQLVREMLIKLKDVIEALSICRTDLKLDRTLFQNMTDAVSCVKNKIKGHTPAQVMTAK